MTEEEKKKADWRRAAQIDNSALQQVGAAYSDDKKKE